MAKERTDAERAERAERKANKAAKAVVKAEIAAANNSNDESLVQPQAPIPTLVAFAQPLAQEKTKSKVLKAVSRAHKHKTLKRGVKEITKATRKTQETVPGFYRNAPAIAIIAADVHPCEVIAHIPVHCEDKSIPFIFVDSRKELGMAGNTKRPTSCLLLLRTRPTRKDQDEVVPERDVKWEETFESILKLVIHERNKCSW